MASLVRSSEFSLKAARTSGGGWWREEEAFARIGERRGDGEEGKEAEDEFVDDAEIEEEGEVEDSLRLLPCEWRECERPWWSVDGSTLFALAPSPVASRANLSLSAIESAWPSIALSSRCFSCCSCSGTVSSSRRNTSGGTD